MSTIIGLVSTFRLPLQSACKLDFSVACCTEEVQFGSMACESPKDMQSNVIYRTFL